jgi:hypothetical protein
VPHGYGPLYDGDNDIDDDGPYHNDPPLQDWHQKAAGTAPGEGLNEERARFAAPGRGRWERVAPVASAGALPDLEDSGPVFESLQWDSEDGNDWNGPTAERRGIRSVQIATTATGEAAESGGSETEDMQHARPGLFYRHEACFF